MGLAVIDHMVDVIANVTHMPYFVLTFLIDHTVPLFKIEHFISNCLKC